MLNEKMTTNVKQTKKTVLLLKLLAITSTNAKLMISPEAKSIELKYILPFKASTPNNDPKYV